MKNVNFEVVKIEKAMKHDCVVVTLKFEGSSKEFAYVRKAYNNTTVIDGCRIYFDANYQVEKVEREYETKGVKKMSTAKQVGTTSTKIKNEIENKGIEIPKVQIPEVKGEVHHDRYDEIKIEASKILKPDMGMIKDIYVIGIPSIIMQAIGSVMVYGLNRILIAFSSTATAVFGVYFKLQSFVFMPIFGMNNGLVPILAYNFGAGKKDRFLKAMKLGIVYAVSIMFVGFVIFNTCTNQLLSLFSASDHMLALGIPALRIISTSFLFAGFCIICNSRNL